MKKDQIIILEDRGLISISGKDSKEYLQNIITNDINKVSENNSIFAALLSPQGKYLYEFFVIKSKDGFLLDCYGKFTEELIKNLTKYKLRSKVEINNLSNKFVVGIISLEKFKELQINEKKNTNIKFYNKNIKFYKKEEINNSLIKRSIAPIYHFVKYFDTIKIFNGVKNIIVKSFENEKNKNEIEKNYIDNLKKFDEIMQKNKINFIILVYDYDDENNIMVNNIKKRLNAKVLLVSEIVNLKFEKDFKEQYTFKLDGHTNHKFNKLIGEYLKDLLI